MEYLSEIFIGLPVAPNSGMGCLYLKTTKWRTAHPEGVTCPTPTSMGPISAGRGRVISGRLANRFGSRFATVPMGKPSTCTGCCDSLPACVKSFPNMLFVGQIETYSLAMDS